MGDQTELTSAVVLADELSFAAQAPATIGGAIRVRVTQQPATLGEAIRLRAAEQPDHPAVIATGFAPLTYRELYDLIRNARNALRGAGFDRNARIAIAMPSGPQAALATAAVSCSAVAIPLNPKQTAREIASSFSSLKPKAVLIAADDQSDTKKAAEDAGVAVIEAVPAQAGTLGFVITARGDTKPNEPDEPDPAAPAFILQTSGTAAEPKLIPFSHRNMLAAAARLRHWFHLTPDDRCLSASPPFYSHGLKVTVFTPLLTGGSVAFPSDSSKFEFSEWFRDRDRPGIRRVRHCTAWCWITARAALMRKPGMRCALPCPAARRCHATFWKACKRPSAH